MIALKREILNLLMQFRLITLVFISLLFPFNLAAESRVLGKEGVRDGDINIFHKWTGVLKKIDSEVKTGKQNCKQNSRRFFCNIDEWLSFVDSIKGKSKDEQLELVNEFANRKEYILDNINWGVEDYWASPGEFLQKNGDCEDYAIIKYVSLLRLGFDKDDLKIVILNDNNLGILHAVLAAKDGSKNYILDNQISKVISDDKIFHYSPIFSINEQAWWRYI